MRLRTTSALALAGVALALVAGCGGSTSATSTPTNAAPSTGTPSTTAVTSTETAQAATVTPTGARPAGIAFRADLTVQRAGLALLALTNTGGASVTVRGWPAIQFLDAAGHQVSVPVRNVSVPGAGPSITIAPGRTAFAGVQWALGEKANPHTFVATSVRLLPPDGTGVLPVTVIGVDGRSGGYVEFDLTSAQVGTLQPSSEGVLVF